MYAKTLLLCVVTFSLSACVKKSTHEAALAKLDKCQHDHAACQTDGKRKQSEIEGLTTTLQARTAERDEEQKKRATAEATIADMGKDLSATQSELENLRKQRAETEKRLAAFRALTAKFQKMIDTGKIQVLIRGGRMIVKLPAGILFASGKADLSAEGQAALREVAQILRDFTDRMFMVAGHTDAVPLRSSRFQDNWELSAARAVTVTRYLVEQGLSPKNLSAAGYGEFDPVGDNANDDGRQKNRRIEIILLPTIEELPGMPVE
jgi:chemotaxis protein MotB